MKIADEHLIIVRSSEGQTMAGVKSLPHLLYPLDDGECQPWARCRLAYQAMYGEPPSAGAVTTVIGQLKARAMLPEPREVHLRSTWGEGALWVDLGWEDGSVLRIDASGWEIQPTAPVLFTRSTIAAALPDPRCVTPDRSLLGKYVHVDRRDLNLVWAVMVSAWFPYPQPLVGLFGAADAGKTTSMRNMLDLVDPCTTQAGSDWVADERTLKAIAALRRVMVFDNMSGFDRKSSDTLARITTGGEMLSRKLYSNASAHVTQLMRPVWMTGIMEGFQQADVASRAVMLTLESIREQDRLSWEELQRDWQQDRAVLFAGLLDLSVEVLQLRDRVTSVPGHRMKEFMTILKCIDRIDGGDSSARLREQQETLSDAVLDSSTIGRGLRRAIECSRNPKECSLCRIGGPMIGEASTRSIFNTPFHNEDLRNLIMDHLLEEEERYLPTNINKFGREVSEIKADLERRMNVSIIKDKDRYGATREFKDLS